MAVVSSDLKLFMSALILDMIQIRTNGLLYIKISVYGIQTVTQREQNGAELVELMV